MWYTMITFPFLNNFLFVDFFLLLGFLELKIASFLCNFSCSSSKPLPELKTSFIYTQLYQVLYTLPIFLEKSLSWIPMSCSSLDCVCPGLWPVLSLGLPFIIILGIPFLPGALMNYKFFYSWLCPHFVRSHLLLAFWESVLGRTALETLHSQMIFASPLQFIIWQDMEF